MQRGSYQWHGQPEALPVCHHQHMKVPTTPVSEVPVADSATAKAHFSRLLAFETDCWDVHVSLAVEHPDFVLLDVRGPEAFASGHVAGAVHMPHATLTVENLAEYPLDSLFVVYCAGPHCNGADKAARNLATLGRPVKKMIGGVTGWLDEGFTLVEG